MIDDSVKPLPPDFECCADWKPGMDRINAPIVLQQIRSGRSLPDDHFKAWAFCPWCGKSRLESGAPAPPPPVVSEEMVEAAETVRKAFNDALAAFGADNPVLKYLRWSIGHLAVVREAALAGAPGPSIKSEQRWKVAPDCVSPAQDAAILSEGGGYVCTRCQRYNITAPESGAPAPPVALCEECGGKGFTVGPICCGNLLNGECRGDCAIPEQLPCQSCAAPPSAVHARGDEREALVKVIASRNEAGLYIPCEADFMLADAILAAGFSRRVSPVSGTWGTFDLCPPHQAEIRERLGDLAKHCADCKITFAPTAAPHPEARGPEEKI